MALVEKEGLLKAKSRAETLKAEIATVEAENQQLGRALEIEDAFVDQIKSELYAKETKLKDLQMHNRELLDRREEQVLELSKVEAEIDQLEANSKDEIQELTLKLWSTQNREHELLMERHEEHKKHLVLMLVDKNRVSCLEESIKAHRARIASLEREQTSAAALALKVEADLEAELRSFIESLGN
jgi:hypothetical protein